MIIHQTISLIDNFFFPNRNSIIWLAITKNLFQKKEKDIIEKRKRRLVVKKRAFLSGRPFRIINFNYVFTMIKLIFL